MSVINKNYHTTDEAEKLQQHLSLLREQYVRLQERCITLEQKLSLTSASSSSNQDSFLARLLKFVASLYDKEEYSDVVVRLCDGEVRAHRFVLAARGDFWGVASLAEVDSLDWLEFEEGVGSALLRWVYTDYIHLTDHQLTLKLIKAAAQFKLTDLVRRCEEALIGWVNVRNCVQLYTTAEEIGAESLKLHCSTLISTHWNDFTPQDFVHMSAPLLYSMFKSKTKFLLHASVRLQREDVLFLYLIEFDSQLPAVLNQVDDTGRLALDLALEGRHSSIAKTLLKHGASVNASGPSGESLLHIAVSRGDDYSSKFLLENGADVSLREKTRNQTPLHVIACTDYASNKVLENMAEVTRALLEAGACPNIQDCDLKTPLHLAIETGKHSVFSALLTSSNIKLNLKDRMGLPPLWYALIHSEDFDDNSFAAVLIAHGAPLNEDLKDGNTLLHMVAEQGFEEAGLFLTTRKANPTICNFKGETALHLSCTRGLPSLTTALLQAGADPNQQTLPPSPIHTRANGAGRDFNKIDNPFEDDFDVDEEADLKEIFRETPLHRAIRHTNLDDVTAILDHQTLCETSPDATLVEPSFDLQDSEGLTGLGVALMGNQLSVARRLLQNGASVNRIDDEGRSLLHRVLLAPSPLRTQLAQFLILHGADPNQRTMDGFSPLQICIQNQLAEVVETLCENGADLAAVSPTCPDPPLWLALDSGQTDIAQILVSHKIDVDGWAEGPEGCMQTLLHRAIDENREDIACFLVQSGCAVNALRQEGMGGRGASLARDMQTPLHMCCSWGLLDTARELIRFGAKINAKDCENKTPLHLALENNHLELIDLLIDQPTIDLGARDKSGLTPFAVAMSRKNNKAAQTILHKHPPAAEQYDQRGLNYLHTAIQKDDLEGVLFLLSIHVSLGSKTKDDRQYTPLHLATLQGNEMIVRNLLLAGASINELTPQRQTCLHLCALHDRHNLATIFLQNDIDADAVDSNLNNALHVAIKEGHLATVRVLLTESSINAGAVNLRGQNPLHVLGAYPKENAGAIAQLFLECMPDYPLDSCDVDGNTALLMAYMHGSGQLCRVLVRSKACLGIANKHGIHLFNYEVATKALLRRLLDAIAVEPPWSDGEFCLECGTKFGLATRRHHCRHCGRLLCSKCSGKDVPILKFGINKPVRVCQMCFDVLTLGASGGS